MEPDASSSPNKRQKTLTLTSPTSSSSSKGKGKEKIPDDQPQPDEDSPTKVCGICFSEGEKSIRGMIDSCDHYFCFVCIMEWAKHESRCPLCKQRFKTIARKPRDGLFLHERLVNVPVRNQVWHPLGIQTDEIPDPFVEVKCTECQSSSDEDLLLLCDLCDSASHTYCVGLGGTVPEGDWFCNDCTVLRNEHYGSDPEPDSGNPRTSAVAQSDFYISESDDENPIAFDVSDSDSDPDVSVLEAVSQNGNVSTRRTTSRNANSVRGRAASRGANSSTRRAASRTVNRPRRRTTLGKRKRPTRRSSTRNLDRSTGRTSSIPAHSSSQVPPREIRAQITVSDLSVRTLSHCRNVHNRIRVMRANWGGLRNGSFAFSGEPPSSDRKSNIKNERPGIHENLSKPQASSSSSMPCGQSTSKAIASGESQIAKNPYDVNKAWKMLDIAKSVQRAREGSQSSHQVSSHKPDNKLPVKATTVTNPGVSVKKNTPLQPKDHKGVPPKKNYMLCPVEASQQKPPRVDGGLLNPSKGKGLLDSSCYQSFPTNPSFSSGLHSEKQTHAFNHATRCQETRSDCNAAAAVSRLNGSGDNARSFPQTEPLSKALDTPNNRGERCESSRSKEGGLDRNHARPIGRKDEAAKSEVQSLVKLNLKLLSRNKPLGVNVFKEVARLATHTILAACGLEHKESNVRPYSDSICRHSDQTKKLHMSNLLPTSCRECFFAFVKDVVNSIVTEEQLKDHP